jgi:predicted RNA-binding Zn-ribbon protein involved in translation (DUF1610 family)
VNAGSPPANAAPRSAVPGSAEFRLYDGEMSETLPCPRCGEVANERFYGPCTTCREALRTMFSATKRDVAVADYEPKMNVTPNAVATKE